MAGAGAGADQAPPAAAQAGGAPPAGVAPEDWRDWAGGVPEHVLMKVAEKHIAQTEADWAAHLRKDGFFSDGLSDEEIQDKIQGKRSRTALDVALRKRNGNCLFVFARVCKPWRKAQLKVGGPLLTRVDPDVILPGSMALAKWALAEGCPSGLPECYGIGNMVNIAAEHGHLELVQWLVLERGFEVHKVVLGCAAAAGHLEVADFLLRCRWDPWCWDDHPDLCSQAARRGNLEILQWLRANDCRWDDDGAAVCRQAVNGGHVEVLRWARENDAGWTLPTRDKAAELGYTDDFGNLVDEWGAPFP